MGQGNVLRAVGATDVMNLLDAKSCIFLWWQQVDAYHLYFFHYHIECVVYKELKMLHLWQ